MSLPPPVPPRPADLRHDSGDSHYDPNIVSPRPHRTDNPAAKLDDLAPPPTFSFPAPFQGEERPGVSPRRRPRNGLVALELQRRAPIALPQPAASTPHPPMPASRPSPAPSSPHRPPPLPSLPTLLEALPSITAPLDPALKITWARDVFFLADRAHHLHIALTTPVGQAVPSVSDPIVGPMPLSALEPEIVQLITAAVPLVLLIAAPFPPGQPYQQNTSTWRRARRRRCT
ncbi:hypothetical protein DFP72DRAFT_1127946 [Ephemerocybe angulata]|uniref:Uncharacterized protein n=1 Tax=Ephemerocybe angulata TaxID=980116 RepID=A0A8H6LU30_9AGAR|nr:hypothetical protein DFP72DRAFT_1127946 [Tulosesus angulatus]